MNPMVKAMAAAGVRWLMAIAGAHGVELGNDQAETLVNAVLVAVPIVWSVYQKFRVDKKIKKVAETGLV